MNQSTPQLSMLAIHDEVSIKLILQHYFKDVFSVVAKGNGKEALARMQEGNIPDIIVEDLNMPEMDGYTFIYQVRSSGYLKNIPMVMLSGSDSTDNKIRCLESGADDFIVKPFNPRELSTRMNGILRCNGKKNS
ncbi:response regulator transcription factor [Ferruginibacter paludis]|uniref:response regulator transcription factor n=1 Tax=Ferruginibacter paludis TaxID=1310417 RepID=UPI0025B44529|nr:response regulator transcription factor [Ferruginibacter paludis]MDN3654643.1 response regulator transcription factor [Ferruginibacter paludis]